MGKGIKALIFGGAVGAALGILYAPRSGKKTRALLAEKTDALWGKEAQKKGTILGEVAKTTKTAVEAGQDIFNEAQKTKFGVITKQATDRGQKWFKDTTNVVEDFTKTNVRPVFAEKNSELRRKIEEARAKIASQVSQNISEDNVKKPVRSVNKTAATKKTAAKKTAPKKKVVKKTTPAAKKPAVKKATTKTAKKTTKTTKK